MLDIDSVNKLFDELSEEISKIKSDNSTNIDLEKEISNLKKKNSVLKSEKQSLEKEITTIRTNFSNFKKKLSLTIQKIDK
jgi:predicted  nucleic acid-binding Zn-ribbon protein